MTRRPHDAESVLHISVDHRIHCVQHAAGGAQRGIPRSRRDDGVAGAQLVKAGHHFAFHQPDVFGRMAQRDLVFVGHARLDRRADQILRRRSSAASKRSGRSGCAAPGIVFFADGVREQSCHFSRILAGPRLSGYWPRRCGERVNRRRRRGLHARIRWARSAAHAFHRNPPHARLRPRDVELLRIGIEPEYPVVSPYQP